FIGPSFLMYSRSLLPTSGSADCHGCSLLSTESAPLSSRSSQDPHGAGEDGVGQGPPEMGHLRRAGPLNRHHRTRDHLAVPAGGRGCVFCESCQDACWLSPAPESPCAARSQSCSGFLLRRARSFSAAASPLSHFSTAESLSSTTGSPIANFSTRSPSP